MARVIIRIGDVFEVSFHDTSKKYFQVIAVDSTQLSSSVIRAFKKRYDPTEMPWIKNDRADIYAIEH